MWHLSLARRHPCPSGQSVPVMVLHGLPQVGDLWLPWNLSRRIKIKANSQ